MWVENRSDELWIGVKGQSNLEIAGSPRNVFWYGPRVETAGGRALDGLGSLAGYQPQPNSECPLVGPGETVCGR